jgi:hypothetical protein
MGGGEGGSRVGGADATRQQGLGRPGCGGRCWQGSEAGGGGGSSSSAGRVGFAAGETSPPPCPPPPPCPGPPCPQAGVEVIPLGLYVIRGDNMWAGAGGYWGPIGVQRHAGGRVRAAAHSGRSGGGRAPVPSARVHPSPFTRAAPQRRRRRGGRGDGRAARPALHPGAAAEGHHARMRPLALAPSRPPLRPPSPLHPPRRPCMAL